MSHALPAPLGRRIERAARLGLAGFLLIAAAALAAALVPAARDGPPLGSEILGLAALALLLGAFVLTFALVATGSVEAAARRRLAVALALFTLAAATWPRSFWSALPNATRDARLYYALGQATLAVFVAGIVLAAPRRRRGWALAGLAGASAHVAIRLGWIFLPATPYDGWSAQAHGWIVASDVLLAAGYVAFAVALAARADLPKVEGGHAGWRPRRA